LLGTSMVSTLGVQLLHFAYNEIIF